MQDDMARRMEKLFAGGLSILMLGAVLWPIRQNWHKKPKDSFPLSYYPMFSVKRSKSAKVIHVVGLDAHGQRHLLPYTYVGRGGLNQVRRQIRRLVKRGRAEQLCKLAAERLARNRDGSFAHIETVQVVTSEYDLTDYFAGDKQLLSERVHASWKVTGEHA